MTETVPILDKVVNYKGFIEVREEGGKKVLDADAVGRGIEVEMLVAVRRIADSLQVQTHTMNCIQNQLLSIVRTLQGVRRDLKPTKEHEAKEDPLRREIDRAIAAGETR